MTIPTSCGTSTGRDGTRRTPTSDAGRPRSAGGAAARRTGRLHQRVGATGVGVLAGRREVVDPDEVEPQRGDAYEREDRGVAALPAGRGPGVEVGGVHDPGD